MVATASVANFRHHLIYADINYVFKKKYHLVRYKSYIPSTVKSLGIPSWTSTPTFESPPECDAWTAETNSVAEYPEVSANTLGITSKASANFEIEYCSSPVCFLP